MTEGDGFAEEVNGGGAGMSALVFALWEPGRMISSGFLLSAKKRLATRH